MDLFQFLILLSFTIYGTLSQKGKGGGKNKSPEPTRQPVDSPTGNTDSPGSECDKHRKPWHELSQSDRDLYINGFLTLSSMGRMAKFTEQHASEVSGVQAHDTAAFLPWHRYMLWELEEQFRSLSGYECFSLPYWDWTYEQLTYGGDISSFNILNSGLGGIGNPDNEYCVEDGAFTSDAYTPYNCDFNINSAECCLVRGDCYQIDGASCQWPSPAEAINLIVNWDIFGTDERSSTFNGYRYELEVAQGSHGRSHVYIGERGHLGNINYSPDDPIFYLIHGFVDYQWALWQDCKDYDQIPSVLINNLDVYGGTLDGNSFISRRGPSRIDDALIFDVLEGEEWTQTSHTTYTPRDLMSIADWGYSYEKGSFFFDAQVETWCPNINPEWFYDESEQLRSLRATAQISQTNRKAFELETLWSLQQEWDINDISVLNKKRMAKTWGEIQCEYNQMALNKRCVRPRYFDDCSDLIPNEETGDIDVTLDELISKVTMSECMSATRKQFYSWAKSTKTLLGLCRGDYDSFCDNSFIHEAEDHACLGQISRLLNQNEQNQDIMNENKQNNKDRIVKSWTAQSVGDVNVIDSEINTNELLHKSALTQTELIVFNAVMNGIVIISILSILGIARYICLYHSSCSTTLKKSYKSFSESNDHDPTTNDLTSDESDT